MSLCADIGRGLTEGTNEGRVTCCGGKYIFSLSVPGYNQSSHLNFLTAAYNCEFGKLNLHVEKEKNIFEIIPKLPIKNLEFIVAPLEDSYIKFFYWEKFMINNLKIKSTIQFDSAKNLIFPSSKFVYKTDNIKTKAKVSLLFENLKGMPTKINAGLFFKSKSFAFGGKIENTTSTQETRYMLKGKAKAKGVKVAANFEPQTKTFSALLKAKINDQIRASVGVDNKDEKIFAVCKAELDAHKYSGSVAVDTFRKVKAVIRFRNNDWMTTEITAAKNFTEEWPTKFGLFFNFNE